MKPKINKALLPIKAHYFFFFAALGPLLPQLNVYGKQMGVSPGVMGMVTSTLPLLWAIAKPAFGYVVDYWPARRKEIFMFLITVMTCSYCCLWFIPDRDINTPTAVIENVYRLNDTIYLKPFDNKTSTDMYKCHWNCTNATEFDVYLSNGSYINTMYVGGYTGNLSCSLLDMELDGVREGDVVCLPKSDCDLLCYEESLLNRSRRSIVSKRSLNVVDKYKSSYGRWNTSYVYGTTSDFYLSGTFWMFVILMCLGTVAFNVANCIGDAVCFDVLGPEQTTGYGAQRAWGTVGYGVTALLGGWAVDAVSGGTYKNFTPAFAIALVATAIDLYSCRALNLPSMSKPIDSGKTLWKVITMPKVLVFIMFAVVAGMFDSFIIYYMFWFLEEMAAHTGYMHKIKLIEGLVIASQCFLGEMVFFFYSGKIIKRFGHGPTLSFSLFCYGVRLLLISYITNPWHLVFLEGIMQGPTYALCYATIVGYAAIIAPEGYSATLQGIVAGMDDGLGFALGSVLGGFLYTWLGGKLAFQALAMVAASGSGAHAILYVVFNKKAKDQTVIETAEDLPREEEKMLPHGTDDAVYRDTVVSVKNGQG